jgi:hypothetical protein
MEIVAHVYKISGRIFFIEPQKIEDDKILCWTGVEVNYTSKGYEFKMSSKAFKGTLKKDVINEIKLEINNHE